MVEKEVFKAGIPISIALEESLESEHQVQPKLSNDKRRLLYISVLAVSVAICIILIAKVLVHLIDFFTNLAFLGKFSIVHVSPASHSLGLLVIFIPVIGGIVIGLMAFYGSKAIRGHGIPEAMEQILTNQSKIRPSIAFLKPVSSAISIGTGGPFGAEGPIIATGGAFGSTIGQMLKITNNERKILLASGATAGMSAIFGSPIAAIFLAIELLLFEFSPRSIIPVALACITGAAGHHLLFEESPVFEIPFALEYASNIALVNYSILGIIIGVLSAFITKVIYLIEDGFEKLPIHWMWWPAIGGLAVGICGYFSPRTLGVGYENITDIIAGNLTISFILSLSLLKLVSWAIALGSGTSGGTLAPLLTFGSAAGALIASAILYFFPNSEITIPLAALVGMSAMFAGASRALLTSIIFALETTGQANALLPLLAGCIASYFVSYFLMENTIMTEKIARRGIRTPFSYEPDVLEKLTVEQVVNENNLLLKAEDTIEEARKHLSEESDSNSNYFIIVDKEGKYNGLISSSNLFSYHHDTTKLITSLVKRKLFTISEKDTLRTAVDMMAKENLDVLPVVSDRLNNVLGVLSYKDIIKAYKYHVEEHEEKRSHITFKKGSRL